MLLELHSDGHADVDVFGRAAHDIGGEPEPLLIDQFDDGDVVRNGDDGAIGVRVRGVREDRSLPARGLVLGGTAAAGARAQKREYPTSTRPAPSDPELTRRATGPKGA